MAFYKRHDPSAIPRADEILAAYGVEELHAAVYGGLERVYKEQRGYAGYPDRTLVVR